MKAVADSTFLQALMTKDLRFDTLVENEQEQQKPEETEEIERIRQEIEEMREEER